jgi:hypothetical protein
MDYTLEITAIIIAQTGMAIVAKPFPFSAFLSLFPHQVTLTPFPKYIAHTQVRRFLHICVELHYQRSQTSCHNKHT